MQAASSIARRKVNTEMSPTFFQMEEVFKGEGMKTKHFSKAVKCKMRILMHTFSKNIKAYTFHIKYSTSARRKLLIHFLLQYIQSRILQYLSIWLAGSVLRSFTPLFALS